MKARKSLSHLRDGVHLLVLSLAVLLLSSAAHGQSMEQQKLDNVNRQIKELTEAKARLERHIKELENHDFLFVVGGFTPDGEYIPFTDFYSESSREAKIRAADEGRLHVVPINRQVFVEEIMMAVLLGKLTKEEAAKAIVNTSANTAKVSAIVAKSKRADLQKINQRIAEVRRERDTLLARLAESQRNTERVTESDFVGTFKGTAGDGRLEEEWTITNAGGKWDVVGTFYWKSGENEGEEAGGFKSENVRMEGGVLTFKQVFTKKAFASWADSSNMEATVAGNTLTFKNQWVSAKLERVR